MLEVIKGGDDAKPEKPTCKPLSLDQLESFALAVVGIETHSHPTKAVNKDMTCAKTSASLNLGSEKSKVKPEVVGLEALKLL